MTLPFGLFDLVPACLFLFAIIAPARFYRTGKFPAESAVTWIPRIRPLGIAALVLYVGGRFLILKLFPQFQGLYDL